MNTKLTACLFSGVMAFFLFCGMPEEDDVRLTGKVDLSSAGTMEGPVFLALLATDNFDRIESDPLESIIKVVNVSESGDYDINLSEFGIIPGDTIYLIAFVDNDYAGGIPFPTAGDFAGFYIDSEWRTSYTVKDADNTLNIAVNKIFYDYETSIEFKIDPNGRPTGMDENHNLIAVAVHENGVDVLGGYMIDDVNYVLGMEVLPYRQDSEFVYSFDILPVIDNRITDPSTMNVYIYVIYDRDDNGVPSSGDDIAAYWLGIITIPKKLALISDTINVLKSPYLEPDNPYAVKFLGQTY